MKERVAIVCGSRQYKYWEPGHRQLLTSALECFGITTVIYGDATGADRLAAAAAIKLGRKARAFPADWKKHGKAAGPIRNRAMLAEGPCLVFALPGGRGTADMVRQAIAADVPVIQLHASHHWWCDA